MLDKILNIFWTKFGKILDRNYTKKEILPHILKTCLIFTKIVPNLTQNLFKSFLSSIFNHSPYKLKKSIKSCNNKLKNLQSLHFSIMAAANKNICIIIIEFRYLLLFFSQQNRKNRAFF